jgi:membrane-associated HD superfamily phosphohydrolase
VHLYEPNNTLRLLTGTGMGLAIAIVLYPAFNSTIWHMVDPKPALLNLRSFALLLILALALDALILLDNPLILYPLSLISAAGVIVLLTMVYTMMLMMVFKVENRYNQFGQTVYALIGGLTVALIQLGLLDFVRYLFTGTWDGFHL